MAQMCLDDVGTQQPPTIFSFFFVEINSFIG